MFGAPAIFLVLVFGLTFFIGGLIVIFSLRNNTKENVNKATRSDQPETNKSVVPLMFASLAVIAGLVVLVSRRPLPQYQQPKQMGAEWKGVAPTDQSQVPPGGEPLAIERFIPKSQQGIDPSKVTTTIEIKTDPSIPAFIPDSISAKRNEIIKLIFKNTSPAYHYDNFVLVQPHKEEEVGEAGFQAGPEGGYIPIMPNEIIAHTKTIPPGKTDTIIFRAPSEPGKYPYISTFPRRWMAMHGELEVK